MRALLVYDGDLFYNKADVIASIGGRLFALEDKKLLKQNIAKEYTQICQRIFRVGVKRIKIDVFPTHIIILTEQNQSAFIDMLEQEGYPELAAEVGGKTGRIFKKSLQDACINKLGIPVKRIFRDYELGMTATYIQLDTKEEPEQS